MEQTSNVWTIPTITVMLNMVDSEFFWILTSSFQLEKKKCICFVCVVCFYWDCYHGNYSTSSTITLNLFFQIPYLRRNTRMILKKRCLNSMISKFLLEYNFNIKYFSKYFKVLGFSCVKKSFRGNFYGNSDVLIVKAKTVSTWKA